MTLIQIDAADRRLIGEISSAMAEAARRSGAWIACRPGCTQCCMGPFPITQLDAWRLRQGLTALDPERAGRVRRRAEGYIAKLPEDLPVSIDADALPDAMDEWPCPALDPETGYCDVYEARPITCRTFGPATHVEGGALAACELCYNGASDEEIAACAVEVDPDGLEAGLSDRAGQGMTLVAFALARP